MIKNHILTKTLPTLVKLRSLLLHMEDGSLIYRIDARQKKAGCRAEYKNTNGYLWLYIDGQFFSAHRVAWKMHYGVDPESELDHINGNKSDNRIANLRLSDRCRNLANSKLRVDNSSGFKGVHFRKDSGKWRAFITVNKNRIWLGQFDTPDEAHAAVATERDRLHGDFANHG